MPNYARDEALESSQQQQNIKKLQQIKIIWRARRPQTTDQSINLSSIILAALLVGATVSTQYKFLVFTMSRTPLPPPPSYHQLKACQFSSWYSTFRNLERNGDTSRRYPHNNVTIRSIIIKPLPPDFIEYLQADGVSLPVGAGKVSSFLPDVDKKGNGDDWSSDDDNHDGSDVNESGEGLEKECVIEGVEGGRSKNGSKKREYCFPDLNEKIKHALDALGPSIPKLNWSCPKDVTWINGGSLKCSTVGDVYLLLQSSDFCMFDLMHALDGVDMDCNTDIDIGDGDGEKTCFDTRINNIEFELVLRKWSNLHPSMEFRCFVSNHQLCK